MERAASPPPARRRWLRLAAVGAALVAADQAQRAYVFRAFVPNESLLLLGLGFVRLTRVPNSGLMFQSHEMVVRPENEVAVRHLPTLALVVLVAAFVGARRLLARGAPRRVPLLDLGFVLLASGGASNLLSHWRSVFVDDTFAVRFWPGTPFCIFDLADVAVCAGLAIVASAVALSVVRSRAARATAPRA